MNRTIQELPRPSKQEPLHRRKAKKSFTLSPETIAFLDLIRQSRDAESVSAVLEEILQRVRREHERAALDKQMKDHYDSMPDSKATELAEWGDFAMRQVPDEEHN